jgi:uncharacterized membrane protein
MLYPLMATRGRSVDRMAHETPVTLDGMAYMEFSSFNENGVLFELADDFHMIRWLQEHVDGAPAIIEAQSSREYLWGGRVAIYTGMPTVLGWRFHQTQQRTLKDMTTLVNQRRSNINAFYTTTDVTQTLDMIHFYNIEYIIVSSLEKAYYPPEGLAKFEAMTADGQLEKVYEEGEAAVYHVTDAVQIVQAVN